MERNCGGVGSRLSPKRTVRTNPVARAGVQSRVGGGLSDAGVSRKRCEPRRRQGLKQHTGGPHGPRALGMQKAGRDGR